MADAKKEMKELFRALGLIGGEIHEVLKDGFGPEDLSSLVELAQNFNVLKDGFVMNGIKKEDFKAINEAGLLEIIMAGFEGFAEGKE